MSEAELQKLDEHRWLLPRKGKMRVPGIVYSSERLLGQAGGAEAIRQVANVACLPGIVRHSLAMPDMHWGYGFPIGGVAAFDLAEGVVSPGGVGYDINCGCRLLTTRLRLQDIQDRLPALVAALFRNIPSGVGAKGPLKLSASDEKRVLAEGAAWAVAKGFGARADLEMTEDGGAMAGADPDKVSDRALARGREQLGTLGSGNHFLEIEVVREIFDPVSAGAFGLEDGQVCVLIHSGSRGLGYQICDDHLAAMVKHARREGLELPDRQLACAPLDSPAGRDYLAAMACAANYAWANRQVLMHWTRETFSRVLGLAPRELGMRLLYDVCHNIAKIETVPAGNGEARLCVHRKGATRAFPPRHPALPAAYRAAGQPVLIPGDMGSGSFVLAGTDKAWMDTFGSTCHGAGRVLSRTQAVKASQGRAIADEMAAQGILVLASGKGTLREEIPEAYKNLEAVVEAVHGAGISRKAASLGALACIKG